MEGGVVENEGVKTWTPKTIPRTTSTLMKISTMTTAPSSTFLQKPASFRLSWDWLQADGQAWVPTSFSSTKSGDHYSFRLHFILIWLLDLINTRIAFLVRNSGETLLNKQLLLWIWRNGWRKWIGRLKWRSMRERERKRLLQAQAQEAWW